MLKCKSFVAELINGENISYLADKIEKFLEENKITEVKSCSHQLSSNGRFYTALLIYVEN